MKLPDHDLNWLERTIGQALIAVPDHWEGPEHLPKANAIRYADVGEGTMLLVRTAKWSGHDGEPASRVQQLADLHRSSLELLGMEIEGMDDLPVKQSEAGVHVLAQVGFGWLGHRDDRNYTVMYALHCHFPGRELLTIQVSSTGRRSTVHEVEAWTLAFLERFRGFLPSG